jgi:hypothetical protein
VLIPELGTFTINNVNGFAETSNNVITLPAMEWLSLLGTSSVTINLLAGSVVTFIGLLPYVYPDYTQLHLVVDDVEVMVGTPKAIYHTMALGAGSHVIKFEVFSFNGDTTDLRSLTMIFSS